MLSSHCSASCGVSHRKTVASSERSADARNTTEAWFCSVVIAAERIRREVRKCEKAGQLVALQRNGGIGQHRLVFISVPPAIRGSKRCRAAGTSAAAALRPERRHSTRARKAPSLLRDENPPFLIIEDGANNDVQFLVGYDSSLAPGTFNWLI